MARIALTGGIACGKSLVARFLGELGVATIDADDVVHRLVPAEERRRLAKVVFADAAARRALEARLHPLVKAEIAAFLDDHRQRSTAIDSDRQRSTAVDRDRRSSLAVAVIPLLFEAHWDAEYDIICCVRSAREVQIARMVETRGYTREEAEARLAAQLPVEEKAAQSHYVIENDGSVEELKEKVREFVEWLKARSGRQQSKVIDSNR